MQASFQRQQKQEAYSDVMFHPRTTYPESFHQNVASSLEELWNCGFLQRFVIQVEDKIVHVSTAR